MRLAHATSSDTNGASLVLVPVGSIEQHGPHLPLQADSIIATAIAAAAANRLGGREAGVWLAPALTYGSSGEHQSFPGTCSIGTDALRLVVVELVRSIRTWARKVVLVNGHGGNVVALRGAVDQLVDEGHDVDWVACATEGIDLHAGRTETSLLLRLCPDLVRIDLAEAGDGRPLAVILPVLASSGVAAISRNGVLGDPTGASAREGAVLLTAMVDAVVRQLTAVAP